ncbi:GDSL-type esterase/lipase family protein [Geodermatophilus normandii]|uniref:GDSL-type esterase/lipase family protein n=1 Tax=Geodermatophilus normandii TaxID=1137989 RepID=UPI001B87CDF1|nr:GDSL-type esterase/lipase family protein [Geodermatophilus normandii]
MPRPWSRPLTVLLAALAGVLLLTPPASAVPGPLRYVALGDSYSAASGVLPPDLTAAQHPGVPPQLEALSADTQLVTMTIGGNDSGVFVTSILRCGAAGVSTLGQGSPCRDTYGTSFEDTVRTTTYPALVEALSAVRQAAPRARVAILGYPAILPPTGGCFDRMPIAEGDVPYPYGLQATLNDAVRRAAAATGVTFVDLSAASAGHDACPADRRPLGRAGPAGHQRGDRAPERPGGAGDGRPGGAGAAPALRPRGGYRGVVVTRRLLLLAAGRVAAAGLLTGCAARLPGPPAASGAAAVLTARPVAAPSALPPSPGTTALGLEEVRDALLHVPAGGLTGPAPLVVVLHGAGGDAEGGLGLLRSPADERGLVLLAPASRGPTWDAVTRGHGPDVALVDRALAAVFAALPVDPERIAVAGFSDGGSYALGLGLANGRLFRQVVAFSPGFVPPAGRTGRPRVFVSHGTADDVLPVDRTSREIVPALRGEGYEVTYREFDGGHEVPHEVAREAADRLVAPAG